MYTMTLTVNPHPATYPLPKGSLAHLPTSSGKPYWALRSRLPGRHPTESSVFLSFMIFTAATMSFMSIPTRQKLHRHLLPRCQCKVPERTTWLSDQSGSFLSPSRILSKGVLCPGLVPVRRLGPPHPLRNPTPRNSKIPGLPGETGGRGRRGRHQTPVAKASLSDGGRGTGVKEAAGLWTGASISQRLPLILARFLFKSKLQRNLCTPLLGTWTRPLAVM